MGDLIKVCGTIDVPQNARVADGQFDAFGRAERVFERSFRRGGQDLPPQDAGHGNGMAVTTAVTVLLLMKGMSAGRIRRGSPLTMDRPV